MKFEEIDVKEILEFPSSAGFGKWKRYFPKDAISHPAKINLNLLEYLIREYTNEGDILLDPMAGTFSTVILAMLNNRNGIGIELEKKFYDWGLEAIKNIGREQTLLPKRNGVAICGDARRLSELLNNHKQEISQVLFSPPYAESISKHAGGKVPYKRIGISSKTARSYSQDDKNIGNLPLGQVSEVIFSPPYANQEIGKGKRKKRWEKIKDREGFKGRKEWREGTPSHYSDNPNNIGNLKHGEIDGIITSPPYEEGMSSKVHTLNIEKQRKLYSEKHWTTQYGKSKNQIGNLKKETYLEAMQAVYLECYKVLKIGGKLIVVIKDFIRNFTIIPLHDHTRKLCESVGFKFKEMLAFKLPSKSFWRIMYAKKYGDRVKNLSILDYEFILVFEKLEVI